MTDSTLTTVSALIRFTLPPTLTSSDPAFIEHTHPVPTFLTQPSPSQQTSQQWATAYTDVLSLITGQRHDQCMVLLKENGHEKCLGCSKEATDCLKTPTSYLHLSTPMVIISLTPTCGSLPCEHRLRAGILQSQRLAAEKRKEEVWSGKNFGAMQCDTCGTEDAKRCAGCGTVAYCGVECQRVGWKGHRRRCERKKIGQDVSGVKGVVEQI